MYGLDNIWKSGIWGCKKNLNIEKIIFKVVQMKFLAMHITPGSHMIYLSIMLSSVKRVSYLNKQRNKHSSWSKTALNKYVLMFEDNRRLFHWRKRYYGLWTLTRSDGLKLKLLDDGFFSFKHAILRFPPKISEQSSVRTKGQIDSLDYNLYRSRLSYGRKWRTSRWKDRNKVKEKIKLK